MSHEPARVVFDCVIFAQALINPRGPAGECLKRAEAGDCLLHLSSFVLAEVRSLVQKIAPHHAVTSERVEALIAQVREYAVVLKSVPAVYAHPIDPKDSEYINLALATRSDVVVSRDRHLLVLMDTSQPEGRAFRERFPGLRVFRPVEFLHHLADQETSRQSESTQSRGQDIEDNP